MSESIVQNSSSTNFQGQFLPSGSSIDDEERREILFTFCQFKKIGKKMQGILYSGLEGLIELDVSSVIPYFKIKNIISFTEEVSQRIIPDEFLEEQIIVHLPPKRRYTVNLKIKSRRKAEPRIVNLEWI